MKKLLTSIITLVLIVFLFTTATYAWIALATVNTIEDLSLEAIRGNSLEISLDGINYYEEIPKELIKDEIKKLKFIDVTSNDGINFFKDYKNPQKAIPNIDYLTLSFYFRTTSQYTEIHLSDNIKEVMDYNNPPKEGTFITSKGVVWKAKETFKYDIGQKVKKNEVNKFYAKDAMRVAFIDKDIVSKDIRKAKIFDLTEDETRGFGKPYGALDYLNKVKGENNVAPKAPKTIYSLSKFSNTNPIAVTYDSYITTLVKTNEYSSNNKPYYKGLVRMNVWLEGWDADAFDAIYNDQLKMQFTFRAVLPTKEVVNETN